MDPATNTQTPTNQPVTSVPGAQIPVAPPTIQQAPVPSELVGLNNLLIIALNGQSATHKGQMDILAQKFESSADRANELFTLKNGALVVGAAVVAVGLNAAYDLIFRG